MAASNIKSTTIKLDQTLKEQAQQLFDGMGLSLNAAVNMFLQQVVREQAIPFRVGEPLPNITTLAAISNAIEGRDVHGGFDSVAALMVDLNA